MEKSDFLTEPVVCRRSTSEGFVKLSLTVMGVFLIVVGCSSQPTKVAIQETCFQCLHSDCIDPNGYLIGFITEQNLYDDGTQKEGRRRRVYGPNACGNLPELCWQYGDDPWKCGEWNTPGSTAVP